MRLPQPRGPLSELLFAQLREPTKQLPERAETLAAHGPAQAHADDDVQVTLFACYALHYQGFDDVDDAWEWHPPLLAVRTLLEERFERSLRPLVTYPAELTPDELPGFLLQLGAPAGGPSLAEHMKQRATLDHFREFAIHRSLYNVMEADPHSWGLPRLTGRAKCALVEIQADEYGNGIPGRMHSELFQQMMAELDLDHSYGGYIEQIPAESIAPLNALSMFGLHRRLRGALLGNLAISEIGSSYGNRRFSQGLERLGASSATRLFYDEHVAADAVHEQIAAYNLCGAFARQFPGQTSEVLFGATVTRELKQRSNALMTTNWAKDRSSLRSAPYPLETTCASQSRP
jgi:Iron-containing redox enzyme